MKKWNSTVLAGLICFSAYGQTNPPNILLILADDLGYADLSIHGCKEFSTPNIDSIGKGGIRFKQGYVSNSVCAPSRAGMLTGRNNIGFEANHDAEAGLDTTLETMADTLKRAGYKTSCIGKWHLGTSDLHYPTERGFDYFCGLRVGSRSYFYDPDTSDAPGSNHAMEINGTPIKFEGYLTDFLTDKAIELITTHQETTPKEPFFMFLSYTAPHEPMHAKPGTEHKYKHIKGKKRPIYASMVEAMDDGIGRVLQTLEERNLRDNTLVVFLSDNGGPTRKNGSSNNPLKGDKGSVWEGGLRVPFMMQWPAKIPAGQERDDMIISLDLLPTFAAIAGVTPPEKICGINLVPYLDGQKKIPSDRSLFWRRGKMTQCAFRAGPFKLVENRRGDKRYLFNMEKDIRERNNLINQHPEVVEKMIKAYKKWESMVPEALTQ